MGLPQKYTKHLRRSVNLFPVWPLASPIQVGDVVVRNRKIFEPVGNLSDFDIDFRTQGTEEVSISLATADTSEVFSQSGASVSTSDLDLGAEAELEISMRRGNSFFLRTPSLSGTQIDNLIDVGRMVRRVDRWRHGKWFVVTGVYEADDFVFLGSFLKHSSARFTGEGKFLLEMLKVGATQNVELASTQRMAFRSFGEQGEIAMEVARIKKNGQVRPK